MLFLFSKLIRAASGWVLFFIAYAAKGGRSVFVSGNGLIFALLLFSISHNLTAGERQKIHIDLTTHLGDVTDFKEGDRVSFLVSLDHDAYVVLIYRNAADELIQLFPNKHMQQNFYKAGLFLSVPAGREAFVFDIQPPFGHETLWAFAADTPLPELKGKYLKDGLKKLTSGIETLRKTLLRHAKSAYGEDRLDLHTRP